MATNQTDSKISGRGLAGWQRELAVQRLLNNLAEDFQVTELASCCGLSRSHFSKAFKTSMGLPPHRWLMRRRIAQAQAMLARPDESIAEIAISCGFADQSHLTRVFHALVGVSPAAWRRQCRAGIAPANLPVAAR